jgi:hypothetical protein
MGGAQAVRMLNRIAVATTFAVLIFAAPAAAQTAAAGPSPTPLILELILAAVVITGMAIRGPVSRALTSVRGKLVRPRAARPVERRA